MTLKINRVPVSPKDYVYTKFGQNPLKDVDSSVHQVKIRPCAPDLCPMTLKIDIVPDSPKDSEYIKFGQNPLKDVDSRVFTRMLHDNKFDPVTLTFYL